ncbi:integrase [Chryseobacterium sp. 6424]|uniref:tyrosine-type recombinase/integrase n=1 Tax=Chryseobacterium sp. 6424 TaxID=2039166 RepID=UPI000EFD7562|nr:tyrosine-type recombinase/integrase [Chryseobacterium sp. 6424]AYO58477.1 integrase [Chryseobacterium sp. 6424]
MLEKFLDYILTEKRYSANTVISYRKDLEDFRQFLLVTEAHEDLLKADYKVVRNFMAHLGEKKIARRSINRKLSTLRSFYLFMMKLGEIQVSPVEHIQTLKFYPEKQIPLSFDEMNNLQMEEFRPQKHDFLKELIIETLYQTGMRRAELTGLLLEAVDLDKLELKVIGKGNKQRIIPMSAKLADDFKEYLKVRKPKVESEKYFFIGPRGTKLNDKFVYSAVNAYLSLVTSKKKKSPHMLRHSFATHVLEHGAEISKVKTLMGHSSLASTQVYTSANIEQLKKVFNNAHPRAIKNVDL